MLTVRDRDSRYEKIREGMAREGLDALLVICDAQIEKKGLLKYITNYRNTLYNLVAIFPLSGEPKLLVPSAVQRVWAERLSWISNVEQESPSLETVLVHNIRAMGLEKARFGIASLRIMNAYTYNCLVDSLPDATFVEASKLIDQLRMIKSPAEQELVRETAALANKSFEVVAAELMPGITEQELLTKVDAMLTCSGAQDIFHLICSKPGDLMPFTATNRQIQKGDSVIVNTELSGPSGYWVQMVRTAFVGEPAGVAGKMYAALVGIVGQLPAMLVPGARTKDIAQWVRDQTLAAGYEVGVHFGHCLGLDVVEAPIISINDEAVLKAGMVLTVHPQFVTSDHAETVWYADCYLIRENGPAEVLTKTEPGLLELNF
jgi:Xaa-Pro aminopeptidase